ncbi:MAG: hypothetical protein ACJ71Q_20295 [Terriglobales bacterium]
MTGFFSRKPWSLDSLSLPAGGKESIYKHILFHPSEPLPDEALVREKSKISWIAGAMDGVLGHHSSGKDSARAFDVLVGLRELLNRADRETLNCLYGLVINDSILSISDSLLGELTDSTSSLDRDRLRAVGSYFVTRSAHREAVKFGLIVLATSGKADDLKIVQTVGRNEEFTLFAAFALERLAPNREQALWELAKSVQAWGRIHTVERLKDTRNPEIQAWMLREGFRNGVMDEYLACICARAGRLHSALNAPVIDNALLDGAAGIIHSLLLGGPAENIDHYAEAADACEAYVNCVWSRRDLPLKHFVTIAKLRDFLARADGWENRYKSGWTDVRRTNLKSICDEIFSRQIWRDHIDSGLSMADQRTFFEADTAANWLGIDTWAAHYSRVKAAPLKSSSWYRLLEQTDDARIDEVLAFAESVIAFDQIATGPADELGLGQEFAAHQTLDWLLQGLSSFPKRGWTFIKAGLQSPVIRNRNMAIRALSAWPRESWPPEAMALILEAYGSELNEHAKTALANLLAGR